MLVFTLVSVQSFLLLSVSLVHSSYVVVVLYTTADVAFQGVGFIDIYFCKFLYNSPDKFSRNPWPVVAGGGRLKRNLIYSAGDPL